MDSLAPSRLLLAASASDNLNYESSDAELEKSAVESEDGRGSAAVLKVILCVCVTVVNETAVS